MTEAEWLTTQDYTSIVMWRYGFEGWNHRVLGWLSRLGRVVVPPQSKRKNLLVDCAVCERFLDEMRPVDMRIVTLAERIADGEKPFVPEVDAAEIVKKWVGNLHSRLFDFRAKIHYLSDMPERIREYQDLQAAIDRFSCDIERDLFGNPFRPVTFAPVWRTETAVTLARTMYDARDFGNMPILADALQDAGCENADVLDHCRGPGPHVRGCWVLDSVLGND